MAGAGLGSSSGEGVQMARPQPQLWAGAGHCSSPESLTAWLMGQFWLLLSGHLPAPLGPQLTLPSSALDGLVQSPAPALPQPITSSRFPGLCRPPAASCSFAQFPASATFPKIQFSPLPLEHCILFNPSPVTPAPALLQLDSKNNLFIHTAHAIIS